MTARRGRDITSKCPLKVKQGSKKKHKNNKGRVSNNSNKKINRKKKAISLKKNKVTFNNQLARKEQMENRKQKSRDTEL